MDTSIELFRFIKKNTILFPLRLEYSKKFLNSNEELWKKRLLFSVDNPDVQIELSFSKYERDITAVSQLLIHFQQYLSFRDVTGSPTAVSVRINYGQLKRGLLDCALNELLTLSGACSNLGNLELLKEISISKSIETHFFPQNSLYYLSHLKRISIFHSSSISDVSCLNGVTFLELTCCPLTTLAGLKDVRTLILHWCLNLVDISSLTNIYEINIRCCDKIKNYDSLRYWKVIYLGDQSWVDVGRFSSVRKLSVDTCLRVKNFKFKADTVKFLSLISPKSHFFTRNRFDCCERVEIHCCFYELDLTVFLNIKALVLSHCEKVTSLSALSGGMSKFVRLSCCQNVGDFSGISHVSHVEIEHINANPVTIPAVVAIKRLKIFKCYAWKSFEGLQNIPTLEIATVLLCVMNHYCQEQMKNCLFMLPGPVFDGIV
jgi:hypothetical protein